MPYARAASSFLVALACLAATGAATPPADDPKPDFTGTWTWMWKDADGVTHHHELLVERTGDKYTANERFDDEKAVKVIDLKIDGKSISFAVERGEGNARYTGKLADSDTINGDVQVTGADNQLQKFGWTAQQKNVEEK